MRVGDVVLAVAGSRLDEEEDGLAGLAELASRAEDMVRQSSSEMVSPRFPPSWLEVEWVFGRAGAKQPSPDGGSDTPAGKLEQLARRLHRLFLQGYAEGTVFLILILILSVCPQLTTGLRCSHLKR